MGKVFFLHFEINVNFSMGLRTDSLSKYVGIQIAMLTGVKKWWAFCMFKLQTSQCKTLWPWVLYKMADTKQFLFLHLDTWLLSPVCHSIGLWWPHRPVLVCICMNVTRLSLVSPWLWKCHSKEQFVLVSMHKLRSDQLEKVTEQQMLCWWWGEGMLSFKSAVCFSQNKHHFLSAVISSYDWLLVIFFDTHQFRYCSLVMMSGEWTQTPMEIQFW